MMHVSDLKEADVRDVDATAVLDADVAEEPSTGSPACGKTHATHKAKASAAADGDMLEAEKLGNSKR